MWGAIFRFIASNLAGLGVGYAASDLFRAVNPTPQPQPTPRPWYSRFTDAIGLGPVGSALLVVVVLGYLAFQLGFIKNRKR